MSEGGGLVGLGWRSKSGSLSERTPPSDPFSTLPPELLWHVYEEVRRSQRYETKLRGAISHTLLPYTRSLLYRNIVIFNPLTFKLLRRTVALGGPAVASLITSFSLEIDIVPRRTPGEWPYRRRLKAVTAFFGALTYVTELTLSGSTFSAHCLLLESFPAANLLNLKNLILRHFCYGFKDPFDPLNWTYLGRFPALDTLSVSFDSWDNECTPLPAPTPPFAPLEKIRNVRKLKVDGNLKGADGWSLLKYLLGQFAALEDLSVFDEQGVSFTDLLSEVSPTLKRLRLSRAEVHEIWESDAVDQVIGNFPQLEFLELGAETYNSTIFRILPQLSRLRQLYFCDQYDASITFAGLSHLISTFSGTESLRVYLEIDEGSVGEEGFWESTETMSRMGWRRPAWTDAFSYEHAVTLVRMVWKSGGRFKFNDSISSAILTELAFREQLFQVDIMVERAPFDALVAMEERMLAEEKARIEREEWLRGQEERERAQKEFWAKQRLALEQERVRLAEERRARGLDEDEEYLAIWEEFWR